MIFLGIQTDAHGGQTEVINFLLAQIAFWLLLFLSCKYIARKSAQRSKSKRSIPKMINKAFRFVHIPLGIFVIVVGLIHGIMSAGDLKSFIFDWGFVTWVLFVLLAFSFFLRKVLKKPSRWLVIHRILTVAVIISGFIHLEIATM